MKNKQESTIKSVTVRVPSEQHARLKVYAASRGMTIQDIVGSYITKITNGKESMKCIF
jgi:predicted DNA binding CopG/RHH family protein